MGRDAVGGEGGGATVGEPGAERRQVHVGVGREDLGERRQAGRAHERVGVERALVGGAPRDDLHHVGPAAERAAGVPPPIALAKHARSGCTP